MRGIADKDGNPLWFYEYINISICKEFGRTEKQLMETSTKFRDDCWLYIIEKANQEYIQSQESKAKSNKQQILNELRNKNG